MLPIVLCAELARAVPSSTPDWEVVGAAPDSLGSAVALSDTNGDGYDDVAVSTNTSRILVYFGSPTGPAIVPDVAWSSPVPLFGFTMTSGDFDGDGFGDLLVDSPGGSALYPGSPAGTVTSPTFRLGDFWPTAGIGDTNGDGCDELAVNLGTDEIAIYEGSPAGLPAAPTYLVPDSDPTRDQGCGDSIAGLDANGDGFADLAVGCWVSNALVYAGGPEGLDSSALTTLDFGFDHPDVQESGDFDGDGYDDLVVSDWRHGNYGGGAWVFSGSETGPSVPPWQTEGPQPGMKLGEGVAAGDLDGDGDDDLVLGAPEFSGALQRQGRTLLFEGDPLGLGTVPAWTYDGGLHEFAGADLTTGEVHGDGAADLLMAIAYASNGGSARLFYGTAPDLDGDGASGADDCDDADPTVFPGAPEVDGDGIDQSCDGLDAGLGVADLAPGDLVVTEILPEPTSPDGQWFELLVGADSAVDLVGLMIDGTSIDAFLVVEPGERVVVGRSTDVAENGGAEVDRAVESLALSGVLVLSASDVELVTVDLGVLPNAPGVAASLEPGAEDQASDPAHWCLATSVFGAGDRGTPGEPNDTCERADEPSDPPVASGDTPPEPSCGCAVRSASGAWLAIGILVLVAGRRQRAADGVSRREGLSSLGARANSGT